MRPRRLHTLGFAALLVTLTVIHCAPTEAQADRRRRWTTYGSDRGRLVVACDMRSATCSDGRQITTTRVTPVPCEVAPGQWEMVPEDTACISWRGLETWTTTTSYLAYGAELDRSPWGALRGGTIEALADGYRVTSAAGEVGVSGRIQVLSAQSEEGPVTLSCIVRTQQPIGRLTLEAGTGVARHFAPFDTAGKWEIVSVSGTIAAEAARWVSVGPRNTDLTPASVDVKACWLTKTSAPGRACWGGEAPVTCAADMHTISTEGWPTEAGDVSLVYAPGQRDENASQFLISAYTFGVEGWEFYIRFDDTMSFFVHNDGTFIHSSAPLTWEPRPYALRVRWGDGIVSFWRDGILVGTRTMAQPSNRLPSTALIGRREASGYANGYIRSLTVRSYEEVSP